MPSPSASVELTSGRIRGRDGAYLGIPYASPPVRERRWHAPVPVQPWAGELDTLAPGPPPPQPVRPISQFAWGDVPDGDEDCLYLNVWTPSSGTGDWPVLSWSIGGGWTVGWTGSGLDDGARLADAAEVVVVTFSYRLGSLGWAFGNLEVNVIETGIEGIGVFGRSPLPPEVVAGDRRLSRPLGSPAWGRRLFRPSAPGRTCSSAPPPKCLSCSIAIRMIG